MSEYTPTFTKPYPDGWKDKPDETTPATAEIMDNYDSAIENIENYLSENPIGESSGDGDEGDNSGGENNGDIDLIDLVVGNSISMGRKEGTETGTLSSATGSEVTASEYAAHAEGFNTKASGWYSHSEGNGSIASAESSHAEGNETEASGSYSHSEGLGTKASESSSHAEGSYTEASGDSSHAEGEDTIASSYGAHSEGSGSKANGNYSHAEGYNTIANGDYSHVQGKYNVADTQNKYAHIVGGGAHNGNRKNIHTLDWQGNAEYTGTVKSAGLKLTDTATGQEYIVTVSNGSLSIEEI